MKLCYSPDACPLAPHISAREADLQLAESLAKARGVQPCN
jgi:hypothetical protein